MSYPPCPRHPAIPAPFSTDQGDLFCYACGDPRNALPLDDLSPKSVAQMVTDLKAERRRNLVRLARQLGRRA